ncbi:hypothetical protein BFP72_16910 [Reichenbachiella sp. 5M10]|nr:hypothetical protein BFP72_16910 [Reichenbachiella sp. 5M10]
MILLLTLHKFIQEISTWAISNHLNTTYFAQFWLYTQCTSRHQKGPLLLAMRSGEANLCIGVSSLVYMFLFYCIESWFTV